MADESVANQMQGLPMNQLISAPLKAACDSQFQLAQSAYKFMTQIGFQNGDLTKPNLLKFNLQRPVETPDGITTSNIEVQAPFLGLVPVPSLLIDDVNIDFQMEVNAATSSKSTKAEEAQIDGHTEFNLGFFGKGHIDVQGKVSSSRENTRSTNQTAKYQVRVSARQQQPTEGLSKLMDIMASCIAPLKIG
ncbi:MAG: DUF2589 domain-containing protein [Flavobacteriaceae bacterium]